jgi:hypothetical protein
VGRWNLGLHADPRIIQVNDNCQWRFEGSLNQEADDASLAVGLKEFASFRYRERGLQIHSTIVVINLDKVYTGLIEAVQPSISEIVHRGSGTASLGGSFVD